MLPLIQDNVHILEGVVATAATFTHFSGSTATGLSSFAKQLTLRNRGGTDIYFLGRCDHIRDFNQMVEGMCDSSAKTQTRQGKALVLDI